LSDQHDVLLSDVQDGLAAVTIESAAGKMRMSSPPDDVASLQVNGIKYATR
jgi:hypothetical protein